MQAMGIEKLSKSQVSQLSKELDAVAKSFRERPLTGPYKYVWLDALEVKCREEGRIVNVACLVAVGVNGDGRREILGFDVVTGVAFAGGAYVPQTPTFRIAQRSIEKPQAPEE